MDQDCKEYLGDFQESFVLVPSNTNINNVLIVWNKHYLDVVLKGLDTCSGTSPQTYTPRSTHMENLVAEHEYFMNGQSIKVPLDMKQPTFKWFPPKIHKNPIGSRYYSSL